MPWRSFIARLNFKVSGSILEEAICLPERANMPEPGRFTARVQARFRAMRACVCEREREEGVAVSDP